MTNANYVVNYIHTCLIDVTNLFVAPSDPCSLEIVTVTSTSVTLQWLPPKYPNGVIKQYSIEYDGKKTDKFGDKALEKMHITGVIEGLLPNTVYVLEMKAYTRVGPGPPVCLTWKTCK